MKYALNNKKIILFGGNATRTFCYVSDAISAMLKILLIKQTKILTFNVGHDRNEITIKKLSNIFSEIVFGILNKKLQVILKKSNAHLNFFTGMQESPLLKIFKDNNYDLAPFSDNLWFGRHKGRYIDNYYVNQSGGKFNTCSFDGGYGIHLKISFLGYNNFTKYY